MMPFYVERLGKPMGRETVYAVLRGGVGGVPGRRTSKGRGGKWDSGGD